MNDKHSLREKLMSACFLLSRAESKLDEAKEKVRNVPPPALGSRDVRFDALDEAMEEVETQRRNVDCCAYFLSKVA